MVLSSVSYIRGSSSSVDQLLDERQCLASILIDVLLVRVRIIAIAAVRIGGVTVRLNDGRIGGRTLVSAGTSRKLVWLVLSLR